MTGEKESKDLFKGVGIAEVLHRQWEASSRYVGGPSLLLTCKGWLGKEVGSTTDKSRQKATASAPVSRQGHT